MLGTIGEIPSLAERLEQFTLYLRRDDRLSPSQFKSFAQSVPNLNEFSCPADVADPRDSAEMSDVSDADFEQVVIRLPRLTSFNLSLRSSQLTNKSLVSLGQWCPRLKMCEISASISCKSLSKDAGAVRWRNLEFLNSGLDHLPIDSCLENGLEGFSKRFFQRLAPDMVAKMPKPK